jgi:hypothetical protein
MVDWFPHILQNHHRGGLAKHQPVRANAGRFANLKISHFNQENQRPRPPPNGFQPAEFLAASPWLQDFSGFVEQNKSVESLLTP